jgi:hypothetical protein
MRVLFHLFSLGEAQIPVALSVQSAHKAPKNPAKRVFLVSVILKDLVKRLVTSRLDLL